MAIMLSWRESMLRCSCGGGTGAILAGPVLTLSDPGAPNRQLGRRNL
jgi:hypothetical protein